MFVKVEVAAGELKAPRVITAHTKEFNIIATRYMSSLEHWVTSLRNADGTPQVLKTYNMDDMAEVMLSRADEGDVEYWYEGDVSRMDASIRGAFMELEY